MSYPETKPLVWETPRLTPVHTPPGGECDPACVGGVNDTPSDLFTADGNEGTTTGPAASDADSGSCSPDTTPHLAVVPGPRCGVVGDNGHWLCYRPQHPANPNGHVYVADNGSHVPDRHQD